MATPKPTTTQTQSAADTIVNTLKPILTDMKEKLTTHVTAENQNLLIEIGNINTRLDTLEKTLCSQKKTPARTTAAKVEGATEAVSGAKTEEIVRKFPGNTMLYFKEKIRYDDAYRAKIVTEDVDLILKANANVQSKVDPEQKRIAEGLALWKHIKEHKPDVMVEVKADYDREKAAREEANKPAQLVADTPSPPNEKNAI